MNLTQLRQDARAYGYLLRPISPGVLQTVEDVASGLTTARALARHHGLAVNSASMRLLQAERYGLLERVGVEGLGVVWGVVG